mmetsp:Transcript_24763/g.61925  ORF Transcript_24763/g.61925 Transcript_24763/m.61925 type:complete len:85 (-) Transcript_24763:535-789(-)
MRVTGMDDPKREFPEPKRIRVTSDDRDVGLSSLPDIAIHRIFDSLREPVKVLEIDDYRRRLAEFESHNQKRSHTCRRMSNYYRF